MGTWKCVFAWIILVFSLSVCQAADIQLGDETDCSLRQFRCANGKCIPLLWTCDGEDDCEDHSDENPKVCTKSPSCAKDEFRCTNGRCMPARWRCDGEKDCSDGSDEDPKFCEKKSCNADEFSCRSNPGECVPLTWMCDENRDCYDGSDEKACNETCRADEFTCANGKCIQKRWVCDTDNDCGDNSDEKDCPAVTCAHNEIQCTPSYCITAKWKCDGTKDCADGKDEENCPPSTYANLCSSYNFECADRIECISHSWVCDGSEDCTDGSDEDPKICKNITCRPDQFQCKDKTCIPGYKHCSGEPECPDGSDELDCAVPVQKCDPKTQFDCGDGQCIPFSQVCDGKQDCPSWEDEPKDKCGKNECHDMNGGCSQRCVDTPAGFYCDCTPGYKLVDNRTCKDINECEIPGSCSQICINEKGTYKCECEHGYMRDHRDVTKCKANEGHASLLFARRKDIRKISLDRHEMTSIVNDTNSATALDFVFRTGMIFWSDVSDQKIYKAPIDEGSQAKVVITHDITTSDGLAVDWIYNHIYWTDTGSNTIELANFEGQMRKILIKDDLLEPRAIALNPFEGWMFWTDWGMDPKIERAGMDGTHRQIIISHDVMWPNGLTLDLVKKRIYWVDAKLNIISSCDYNGRNRSVVLSSTDTLKHPFSITTFEDWVYWTDWDKAAVFKANKFTGKDVQAVTASGMIQHPMVIHVYHPFRQPDGENHCQAVNGHCSHLCLPAPQINQHSPLISCACPENLKMLPDGLTCVQDTITSTTTTPYSVTDITEHSSDISHTTSSGANNKSHIDSHIIPEESDSGTLAIAVIVSLSLVLIVIFGIGFLVYKHYLHRNMTSMNFDNPVYRKTTEDQFSLEKNAYPQQRMYPSTVGEEAQEPLTGDGNSNDFV